MERQNEYDHKSRLDHAHVIERMVVKKMDEEMKRQTRELKAWKEIFSRILDLQKR
jgi:hypothetical protein